MNDAVRVIDAKRTGVGQMLAELVRARELIGFFIWRDVKVRYKQTMIGVAWAVLQPLLLMTVFTIFFGRIVRVPETAVEYAPFAYAGLVPWTFFAHAVGAAANSLVDNRNLLSKVYFSRASLPVAAVIAFVPDLMIASVLLAALAALTGTPVHPGLALVPVAWVAVAVTASVVALLLATLNVRYRDVRQALPFVIQLWFFCTPIVYPTSVIPASYRPLLAVNPMVGVVELMRWAVFGQGSFPTTTIALSAATTAMIAAVAVWYFARSERSFSDLL